MTTHISESTNAVALAMELQRAKSHLSIAYSDLLKYGDHLVECKRRPAGTECHCGFHDVYLKAATAPRYPLGEPPVC